MILQALYRYYQVLQDNHDESLPTDEYSSVGVSFEIHLDDKGHLNAIVPYVNEKGKIDKRLQIVPKQEKRTSGIKPYFLCDKAEYLLGAAISMREKCRQEMVVLWDEVLRYTEFESLEIQALRAFLDLSLEQLTEEVTALSDGDLLKSLQGGGLCVLKYAPTGDFFHRSSLIKQSWEKYCALANDLQSTSEDQMTCLVSGERMPMSDIARLHPNIKNVVGAQSSGAALVSFNVESFCSYGHEQSYNAPTSQKAADAYGYVLNKFLAERNHHVRMNDTTLLFWAETSVVKEQEWLASLFQDFSEKDVPNEDSIRSRVKSAVMRIQQGQSFRDTFQDLNSDATFYLLGLSPNAARLSVRFWYRGTLGQIGEQVWKHYSDLSIIGLERSPSVKELLREIAVGHEWANIPPNMEGQMLRSILQGLPYSRAIFAQLMNRIRSEADDPKKGLYKIGTVRAAMIKAYLIRHFRAVQNPIEGEITMTLNRNMPSVAYHLGRLFACLEKTQVSALGQGINATIRDRFWGAASATPANVFPRLLSLAQHHIAKDEDWGRSNDQKIQEVMNDLPTVFPKRLSLEEQGMFALGYYHQRQDLYTKKAEK